MITESLISDIIGKKVTIKENLDRYIDLNMPDEKFGIMDLRTILEDGSQCNIEVQLNYHKYEIERFLMYLCKMYSGQLKRGESYSEVNKVISIVILDHELPILNDFNTVGVKWKIRDNITGMKVLTDKLEVCIIEIPKAKRLYEKNKNDKICQWMLFMDEPNSKEVSLIMEENKNIQNAVTELSALSEDEKLRIIAEYKETARREEEACLETAREIGLNQGREEGIKQGLKEGEEKGLKEGFKEGLEKGIEKGIEKGVHKGRIENSLEIAKKMKEENFDIEIITKITGLSKEDVIKL